MALLMLWTAIPALMFGVVMCEAPRSYPASGVPFNSIATAPIKPYVQQYAEPYREPPSYGVQTGYEGYLIPAPLPEATDSEGGGFLSFLADLGQLLGGQADSGVQSVLGGTGDNGGHSLIAPSPSLLVPLLQNLALPIKLLGRLGIWMFPPVSLLLLGGALTVAVCVFTPVCTLSFLGFGFSKESVRSFINPDRLASISKFVTDAVHKYRKMQKRGAKKEMRRLSIDSSKKSDVQQKPKAEVRRDSEPRTK
ncbi:uncharacterized protein LOC111870722 isoform X2 [Cryptotermes secundus]|nr:uncharacterized protein LOC111870722 isoform X2 [Cryptotermes secundus]